MASFLIHENLKKKRDCFQAAKEVAKSDGRRCEEGKQQSEMRKQTERENLQQESGDQNQQSN